MKRKAVQEIEYDVSHSPGELSQVSALVREYSFISFESTRSARERCPLTLALQNEQVIKSTEG